MRRPHNTLRYETRNARETTPGNGRRCETTDINVSMHAEIRERTRRRKAAIVLVAFGLATTIDKVATATNSIKRADTQTTALGFTPRERGE